MNTNYQSSKKIFLFFSLIFFFFGFFIKNASADSTVSITNYYNASTGETCNLSSLAGNCSIFQDPSNPSSLLPTGNYLSSGDSTGYGGWGISGASIATSFVSTYVNSGVGVSRIPAHLRAVSATYVCNGPTGVTMRSVPAALDSGSRVGFEGVDTTGQDCVVTINFNQVAVDPGSSGAANLYSCQANSCLLDPSGYFSDSSCGGQCGVNFNNPSSISISVVPSSVVVDYGVATTTYFNVTVSKNGNFGADILPWCEVLVSNGSTAGECSFVDGSGNPIARTKYGQPTASAAFTRYPSYYMASNVSSVNLRLAVRNYDQYGGYSSVKTHVIPVQAGLIEDSSPSGETLVCNGSCIAGANINFIVQNPLVCQATTGVSATSPAASNRTFNLSWLSVSGASSYTVEVRDQTSCVQPGCGPLILNTTVGGTTVNVPYGGDVAGVTNKRFGYVIRTNYSPARNSCQAVGSVLVAPPSGGGGGGGSGSVTLLCNGVQNATISSGQSCNLTWNSVNTVANSCVASGNWSGSGKPVSGSETINNITTNQSYTLTCGVVGGGTTSGTATVNVTGAPTADLNCNGADSCTVIRDVGTADLSWTCTNSVSGSVSPGGYNGSPNGSQTVGPFSSGPQIYTLTCTSATGAIATDSITVNVTDTNGSYSYIVEPDPNPLYFSKPRMSGLWGGKVLVTNTGSQPLNVSVNRDGAYSGWFNPPNPSSCFLNSAGIFGSQCLIYVSGITDPLPDGVHVADLNFTEVNAGNKTLPVTVEITGPPSCPSGSVVLSSNNVNRGSTITASAPAGFSNCSYFSNNPGVASVNQSTGTVTGNSVGSTGIYASWCNVYGGAISCPLDATTVNVVEPASGVYSFSVSNGLTFTATEGSLPSPSTRTITVTNTGNQNLNITRTYNMTTGGVNWGNADSSSFSLAPGASRIVNVNITSTSLSYGTYDGFVTFTDTNAGQKSVPVTYVVSPSSSTRTVDIVSNWCGVVTSSPVGINCGSVCQYNFNLDTNVTLTATPNAQCVFVGWLGDCSGQGSVCSLFMNNNKSATPIFGLKPFDYKEF